MKSARLPPPDGFSSLLLALKDVTPSVVWTLLIRELSGYLWERVRKASCDLITSTGNGSRGGVCFDSLLLYS